MAKEYSVTKNGGQKMRAQTPASNAKDGGQRKAAQSPTAQRVQGNGSSVSKSGTPKYRTIEETMDLLGVGQKKDRYSFKAEQEERRAQQSMRQTVPETKTVQDAYKTAYTQYQNAYAKEKAYQRSMAGAPSDAAAEKHKQSYETAKKEREAAERQVKNYKKQLDIAGAETPDTSVWGRIKDTLSGTGLQRLGSDIGGLRTLYEAGQKTRTAEYEEQLAQYEKDLARAKADYEAAVRQFGADGAQMEKNFVDDYQRKVDAYRKIVDENVQQRATQATSEMADELTAKGGEKLSDAKTGLGSAGRFAVDAGSGGANLLLDAALGRLGGPAITNAAMGFRAFGQTAQEAEAYGADIDRQLGAGVASAAKAILTNKFSDGLAGLYGKGAADEVIEQAIGKLAKSDAGRNALRLFAASLGEGTEEVVDAKLDPLVSLIYDNGEALKQKYGSGWQGYKEAAADDLYAGLIGFALGMGGQAVSAARGDYVKANAELTGGAKADENVTAEAASVQQEAQTPKASPQGRALVEGILSSGRVNATTADAILSSPELTQAFIELTGRTPAGNTESQRKEISRGAREYAYSQIQAQRDAEQAEIVRREQAMQAEQERAAQEKALADYSAQEAARDAEWTAHRQKLENYDSYDSYIRGEIRNGMSFAEAGEIARTPKLRSTWERMTGQTLPESTTKAREAIMNYHADAATPGETFNAVDALADYGKPAEATQTRTETQGDNPAPAKAESVKQAGSDVLNSVLNLNSKNTQPKMTTEQIYNEYFAPKTQPKPADNGTKAQKNTASTEETEKTRLNMADYADNNSGVWNNLSYDDMAAQTKAMQDAHKRMMSEGRVVNIPESTLQKTAESFPDLRGMKKSERTPILKQKMTELKTDIRKFLNGLKNGSFEFEINGNILEAKLYDTGIKEVMEKVTQDKANMLSHSDQVFNNAEYLYSLPDYEGNPNVYRWNYFYTPVQIGDTTVGVRIAVRDMATPAESQIYNWGIKKAPTLDGGSPEKTSLSADVSSVGEIDASLDGARRLPSDGSIPGGVSSEALEASASTTSIPTRAQNVKGENAGNAEGGQGRTRNGQYVLEDYESSPKEKERGFSRNVRTDNAMDATIRESFDATPETYEQLANKDTLTKAKDIFSKGISEARSEVEQALGAAKNGSKLAPEMVPLARMVANELSKTGDVETARRILADVATELTAAGQLGQAGRILRNTDSNTALASIQKSIDAINTEFAKQHKNSKWKAELTAAETEKILSTDFTEKGAYERIYDEIATRLGKEMPSSVLEKLTEIRRINMLLRPRTQIKNVAANVPMIGLRKGAETLSIGIQSALTKTGFMDKTDRTRGWASKEQRQLAKDYYEANKADINGQSNKWDFKSALREKRTIFKGGAIEKAVSKMTGKEIDSFGEALRQVTYSCLEKGDAPFVKSAFVDSLAQYCAAKGITTEAGIPQEAIDFATANAMEATFKNANVIADIVNQAKRNSSPGVSAAIDVLIPFTTTPANILSLMGDYSPVGFGKMIAKDGPAAKIDAFSKASVGTAMLALGFALRNAGIITGGEDDDKDKAALDKATGQGTYSFPLSIGGSVSYDWAQPVGSLMAFGAEIADAVKGQESWDSAVMNAIYTAGDATLNLSLFQNIISVLRGSGKPTQQIIDAIMEGGATQLVPGLAGDIAKIIDGTVRSTYTGGNVFDDIGAKVLSTTPGFSKKLPASVNVRGEENTRGGLAARAANTLLNPTNYTGGKRNAVDEEIYRLYDTTGSTVFFPSVSPYKIEYGNETYTMNGKDRETFQKVQGQTYYDLANPLLSSEMYKALSDEQKASVLKSIRDYALDAAKRQFVDGQGGEYSNSQWDPIAELTKGQISAYIPAKQALKDGADGKGGKKAYDAVDLLLDNYGKLPKTVQARLEGEDLNVNKLLYADALGIGSKDYYAASKAVSDGKAKLGTSDVAKAISVYNNMKGKSDGEILSAIKAQVPPAKGGKQSSTVRRIEAYSKLAGDDADLGKWLELCASLSDADENSSVTKADVYTAWANMGLGPKDKYAGIDRNGFYNIVKSSKSLASNPDYATQIDEVYALLVPAEEKTKPKLTGTVQGGATGSKSVQHWSYEDIMESLGLAAKK